MLVIRNEAARRVLKILIPFVLIPLTVLLGVFVFDAKRYAFIALAVTVLSLFYFLCGFEQKKTGTRRLILVAVMAALCVAGRFIPLFKPVTALTVLCGLWLGGEAGFLCGALAAVVSDFSFGMGPWTPFQMLAWGLIGLFAGLLSTVLKKGRVPLLLYGALAGILFSLVMDVWTVLWYRGDFDLSLYLAALVTAAPHTLLYAASNVLFLWLLAKPVGEKLARIRVKYGV